MRTPEMDTNLVETRGEPLKALFCGKQPLSSAYERATRAETDNWQFRTQTGYTFYA